MGEMKVKLSHTKVQMEQMMRTMQRLFQTKSADGGQLEEKSGGTGKGDAKDDTGGAGRASREKGAACARVGATTATAAGGRVPNHSSRASDGSRPADDLGRRPEVPAGVGPIIYMQRGEAKYFFLAGIAAHDGDGILSSGFQRQPRCYSTCVERRERGVSKIQKRVPIERKHAGHVWPLRRSGGTSSTSRRSAQREGSVVTGGFSSAEIRGVCTMRGTL